MTRLCKFVLPLAAAATLAVPGIAFADCSPSHGATASMPAPESVAQTPTPATPAPMPGSNG